jgi:tripartite-type tricarboxylate transporter receptor subunit TctC
VTRPLRYIVPFGAGPTAAQAQWLAHRLSQRLGRPVLAENHPGASGMTGTALVAQADPDGYTLLAANPGPLTVGPNLHETPGYDPLRDFAPIVLMATVTSVIAVHPGLPAESIKDLIALARRRIVQIAGIRPD